MFQIKDIQFIVKYAYLDAFIDDNEKFMNIGIKIETEKNCFIDSIIKIESEILLKIEPYTIKKWLDIVGRNIEWHEFPEIEMGNREPYMFLVNDKNNEICNAKIVFKNIDNKIYIKINAFSKIINENNHIENVPIEIETEIDFFIIFGGYSNEKNCREENGKYINVIDYNYFKTTLDVSILLPSNINMEKFKIVFGENYIA